MIKHYRGKENDYNPQSHGDGLYFATDTHKILHNGHIYGMDAEDRLPVVAAKAFGRGEEIGDTIVRGDYVIDMADNKLLLFKERFIPLPASGENAKYNLGTCFIVAYNPSQGNNALYLYDGSSLTGIIDKVEYDNIMENVDGLIPIVETLFDITADLSGNIDMLWEDVADLLDNARMYAKVSDMNKKLETMSLDLYSHQEDIKQNVEDGGLCLWQDGDNFPILMISRGEEDAPDFFEVPYNTLIKGKDANDNVLWYLVEEGTVDAKPIASKESVDELTEMVNAKADKTALDSKMDFLEVEIVDGGINEIKAKPEGTIVGRKIGDNVTLFMSKGNNTPSPYSVNHDTIVRGELEDGGHIWSIIKGGSFSGNVLNIPETIQTINSKLDTLDREKTNILTICGSRSADNISGVKIDIPYFRSDLGRFVIQETEGIEYDFGEDDDNYNISEDDDNVVGNPYNLYYASYGESGHEYTSLYHIYKYNGQTRMSSLINEDRLLDEVCSKVEIDQFVPLVDLAENLQDVVEGNIDDIDNLRRVSDVSIYCRRNDGEEPSKYHYFVHLHDWNETKALTYVPEGVALLLPGKILIIALTESPTDLSLCPTSGAHANPTDGTNTTDYAVAIADMDGRVNTSALLSVEATSQQGKIVDYCNTYATSHLPAGTWWLPSCGELVAIMSRYREINYALSQISGATQLKSTGLYCSSTLNNYGIFVVNPANGQIAAVGGGASRHCRAVTTIH